VDSSVRDIADSAGYIGKTYITVIQYIGGITMSGIVNVALSVLATLLYGGFSYAIAHVKNDESFDAQKFGKFIVIGFIVGGLASSLGLDIGTVENMSLFTLLSIVLDKIAGAIFTKKK
jgi:hypothetical protein